jgi:hypothetical protein
MIVMQLKILRLKHGENALIRKQLRNEPGITTFKKIHVSQQNAFSLNVNISHTSLKFYMCTVLYLRQK